jgi:lipoate-protein ligase A
MTFTPCTSSFALCYMIEWRFIDSGPCPASYNMAVDEAIATAVREGNSPATLRIYGWEKQSLSLGSFQKISDVNIAFCAANDIPVVRRPTGGRAIFHGDEITYSFCSVNEPFFSKGLLDSYRLLSSALKSAFDRIGLPLAIKTERESARTLSRSPLCFDSTSYGELTFKGAKIVGSAQKRWKDGLLQQGSIPFSVDREFLRKMLAVTLPLDLRPGMTGLRNMVDDLNPEKLKEAIRSAFEKTFGTRIIHASLSSEESRLARELEIRKYLSEDWLLQRQAPYRQRPVSPP